MAKREVVHLIRWVTPDQVRAACGLGWWIEDAKRVYTAGSNRCRSCARTVLAKQWAEFTEEINMDQLIVTLDGKDHKIGQGEHTICYLPVPHGSTREEGAKECKVCFAPEHDLTPVEEPTPEPEPEKPAKASKKA